MEFLRTEDSRFEDLAAAVINFIADNNDVND
jgi:hypothetical protein